MDFEGVSAENGLHNRLMIDDLSAPHATGRREMAEKSMESTQARQGP
jgi:hypothetical protein